MAERKTGIQTDQLGDQKNRQHEDLLTDRQKDQLTDRQGTRKAYRQEDLLKHTVREAYRQTGMETNSHSVWKTDR